MALEGQKLFYQVHFNAHPHAQPPLFHPHGEGGEFDVAEDTPRVQENIHAKFHEHRFISVAVKSEQTHRHTDTQTDTHTHGLFYRYRLRGHPRNGGR